MPPHQGHCASPQRDLSRLERWAERNLLKLIKGPAPGEEQPQTPAQAGANLLGSSFVEKDLGALVDKKLPTSQKCVLVAKVATGILESTGKSIASRSGWGSCSSPQPCEAHLECCVQFWVLLDRRDTELLERGQQRLRR